MMHRVITSIALLLLSSTFSWLSVSLTVLFGAAGARSGMCKGDHVTSKMRDRYKEILDLHELFRVHFDVDCFYSRMKVLLEE